MPEELRSWNVDVVTDAADIASHPTPTGKIASITVEPGNIFTDDEAGENILYLAANYFHIPTRPYVIRRVLLFNEGDPADPVVLAETERNLRLLDWIQAATVTARPRPDGDSDVLVETRDKWSLRVGVGFGLSGGVGKGQIDLGDQNLLGLGKVGHHDVEHEAIELGLR